MSEWRGGPRPSRIRPGVDPIVSDLRRARLGAGLRQKDLAQRLGVSTRKVGSWETGEARLPLAMARRWARVVGLELRMVAQ